MMKKMLTLILVTAATVSLADINIQWRADAGFYTDAGGSTELLASGNTALAQLIFTPSGTIAGAVDVGDFLDTGDNEVLSQFVLSVGNPNVGSAWGDFVVGPELFASYVAPGYVYARIFTGETPVDGMWYYNSPLLAVANYDPLNPSAQFLYANRDDVNGDGIYDGAANCFQTVGVPEPTSLALMGVAGLLAIVRRFKKA